MADLYSHWAERCACQPLVQSWVHHRIGDWVHQSHPVMATGTAPTVS